MFKENENLTNLSTQKLINSINQLVNSLTCFFVSLKEFLVNLFKEFFAFAQQHVRSADACLTRNRPLSPSIFLYLLLTSYKDSSTSESIEAPSSTTPLLNQPFLKVPCLT